MTPAEFRRMKAEKTKPKLHPHKKISNSFIDSAIIKNNANAIKTILYLASVLKKENIDYSKDLNSLTLDMKQMLKYTEVTAPEIRRTLKQMQETSISFINEIEEYEEFINLLPYIKFQWGKNLVDIKIFSKIAKLIVEVENKYTFINTKTLMSLKNKHSLRLLLVLNKINQYSDNVGKRKQFYLEDLNELFGTNYSRLQEIERKILIPVLNELDLNSKLTFVYEINYDNLGKGRPKATSITIDVIDNSNSLFAQ